MKFTLGNYYPGQSFLHRLDPRFKLLFSLLFMVELFLLNSLVAFLAYGLFLLVLAVLSGIPARKLLSSVKPVLFLLVVAFLLNLFTSKGELWWSWGPLSLGPAGLLLGLKLAVRLFYLVLTTSLMLTLVTTPLALADALEALLRPLSKWGFPSHELAMMMSIALRFIPTLAEETDKIMKAQSSRGADFDTGGLMGRMRGLVTVLIPLFVSAFQRAEDLALAMEARCYRGGEGRSKLRPLKWSRLDTGLSLLFAGLALGFFLCNWLSLGAELSGWWTQSLPLLSSIGGLG